MRLIDSGHLQISPYVKIGDRVLGNKSTEHMIDSGPLQISSYVEIGMEYWVKPKY